MISHSIDKCALFLSKIPEERFQLLKSKHVSPRCLQPGHTSGYCKSQRKCNNCGSCGHQSLLNFGKSKTSLPSTAFYISTEQVTTCAPTTFILCHTSNGIIVLVNILMATWFVKLELRSGQSVVATFLDTSS